MICRQRSAAFFAVSGDICCLYIQNEKKRKYAEDNNRIFCAAVAGSFSELEQQVSDRYEVCFSESAGSRQL